MLSWTGPVTWYRRSQVTITTPTATLTICVPLSGIGINILQLTSISGSHDLDDSHQSHSSYLSIKQECGDANLMLIFCAQWFKPNCVTMILSFSSSNVKHFHSNFKQLWRFEFWCWHQLLQCGRCIHPRQYFRRVIGGPTCFGTEFLNKLAIGITSPQWTLSETQD